TFPIPEDRLDELDTNRVCVVALYPSNALRCVPAQVSRLGNWLSAWVRHRFLLLDPDGPLPADYLASPGRARASLFAVIAPSASQAGPVSATANSQHIGQPDLDSLFPARESLSDSV
ncbi:MAG TPA: hypothetical protein VI756_05950, partial [Blastocatellia bacterium]